MGYLVQNMQGKEMEMNQNQCSSSSSTKVERKIIEKNRRNQMKNLYSKLNSLLPNQSSKEALSVPDQIDEAVNYIKSLEKKVKECKEKKEKLMGKKRLYSSTSPQIEIHETGSTFEVFLTSGIDNQFIFYEVIRILHEDGAEVVNANFSVVGSTIFHVIHAQIEETMVCFGAAKISERLNRFVNGFNSELEFQQGLWDFDHIHPESLEF